MEANQSSRFLTVQTSSKSERGKKQGNEDWQSRQKDTEIKNSKELNREFLLRFTLSNDWYLNMKMSAEKYSENLGVVEATFKAHDQVTLVCYETGCF